MRIPNLTRYQVAIEILCFLLVIVCVIATVIIYPGMPDEIPSHYDMAGNITDYQSRGIALMLPITNIFLYALITVMACIPAIVENPNMPWPINPAMKPFLIRETVSVLGECKLGCILTMDYMQIFILRCTELITWPVWLFIALLTVRVTVRIKGMKKYKL